MKQRWLSTLLGTMLLCGMSVELGAKPATHFSWSSSGSISGLKCTQIIEGTAPMAYTWRDNYLCTDKDIGLRWSPSGPLAGMKCTQIVEGAEPAEYTWRDNYLCLPQNSPITLRWSPSGPIAGMDCVQMIEGSDPYGWHDNFLCYSEDRRTADLLSITKIKNVKPAGGLDAAGEFLFGAIGAAISAISSGGVSLGDLYSSGKMSVEAGKFLDQQFSGQDDLIVKVDGRTLLPQSGSYFAIQGGQVIYPELRIPIIGAGQLQLIEWDGGSDNDNLGTLTILGGRSYTGTDVVILAPAKEDGSIYLVSYEVVAGLGNPKTVVNSMLCGTNQCNECNRLDCAGQPYGDLDRDGDKPDLLRCPPHFRDAGFIKYPQAIVDDVYLRICRHMAAQ